MAKNRIPILEKTAVHILVVDDDERNRELLHDLLEAEGYVVTEAENGRKAIELAQDKSPDVILLDVMMPELDGFETCKILKNKEKTAAIPVLMVTSLTGRDERLRGIDAGATDFLSKPVDRQEMILRVRNAFHSKHLYDELGKAYKELQELQKMRDSLIHMIVHDLKNPLTPAISSLDFILETKKDGLSEEHIKFINMAKRNLDRLLRMIQTILDINKLEQAEVSLDLVAIDTGQFFSEVFQDLQNQFPDRDIHSNVEDELPEIQIDKGLIERVIWNLMSNAHKHTISAEGEISLNVSTDLKEGVMVSVTDNGEGIPKDQIGNLFKKFSRVKGALHKTSIDTGLGLALCRLAVEAHGGRVWVKSDVSKGSTFSFTIPEKK